MRRLLYGLCALALVIGVVGCSDSGNKKVGENPSDRSPAASPPTSPPSESTTPPPADNPSSAPAAPATPGGMPGQGGTK
jgi:hypothetical protein